MQTKIATCCYCGTRAALVLTGVTKHELSCAACGAPLHNLKHMPVHHDPVHRDSVHRDSVRKVKHQASFGQMPKKKKKSKQKIKKRKSLFAEAFDLLEDIFD